MIWVATKTIFKGGADFQKILKKQAKKFWKILTKRFFGFWKNLTAIFSARPPPSKLIYIGSKNGYLKIVNREDPLGRQGVKFLRERNNLPPPPKSAGENNIKKSSRNFTFHYRGNP